MLATDDMSKEFTQYYAEVLSYKTLTSLTLQRIFSNHNINMSIYELYVIINANATEDNMLYQLRKKTTPYV